MSYVTKSVEITHCTLYSIHCTYTSVLLDKGALLRKSEAGVFFSLINFLRYTYVTSAINVKYTAHLYHVLQYIRLMYCSTYVLCTAVHDISARCIYVVVIVWKRIICNKQLYIDATKTTARKYSPDFS